MAIAGEEIWLLLKNILNNSDTLFKMFLTIKVTIKLVALFLSMVVSLPILLYRVILSGCMSYFCSLQMVEARSSFFLAEDIYAQNSYTSMLLIKLGGCLDVTQLRELVAQRLINSPKYPELSSIVVYKFGYMFWKKVPNFNLDRHVLDLEGRKLFNRFIVKLHIVKLQISF